MANQKIRWSRTSDVQWHTRFDHRGYSGQVDYDGSGTFTLTASNGVDPDDVTTYNTLKLAKSAFAAFLFDK